MLYRFINIYNIFLFILYTVDYTVLFETLHFNYHAPVFLIKSEYAWSDTEPLRKSQECLDYVSVMNILSKVKRITYTFVAQNR